MSPVNDPVMRWVEQHPASTNYIAVVVTLLLVFELLELVTSG